MGWTNDLGRIVDTFRHLNPATVKYGWWSYRAGAGKKCRLENRLLSCLAVAQPRLKHADILTDIMGSDHCPVLLDLHD